MLHPVWRNGNAPNVERDARKKGIDRADVIRLVVDEGLMQIVAARLLGVSPTAINRHLQQAIRHGEIEQVGEGEYRRKEAAGESA